LHPFFGKVTCQLPKYNPKSHFNLNGGDPTGRISHSLTTERITLTLPKKLPLSSHNMTSTGAGNNCNVSVL